MTASVHFHPGIFGGEPTVVGTNIPVSSLVTRVLHGETIAELAEDYQLPEATIREAAAWAASRWTWNHATIRLINDAGGLWK